MSDDKDQWKQTSGLAADSTVAQIVCKEPDKKEWDSEAEEKGYLAHHRSEEKIAELRARIKDLETQLEREKNQESGTTELADIDFLEKVLSAEYQTLPEIVRAIVESGELDNQIRKPVEDELYYLASQDRVEYERGHGWRLTDRGDENGR